MMANNDGSVEVRITGSVDPSLAASAAEAKAALGGLADGANVSAKAMAAALTQVGGDLKKLTPEIIAAAQARVSGATAETAAIAAETAATVADTVAKEADTVATTANTVAHINSRAAYEGLVLVHEALSGRFSRMGSSALILTQALAGQERVASALTWAMSGTGMAVIGLSAAVLGGIVLAHEYSEAQQEMIVAAVGLGAASGVSAQQIDSLAHTHLNLKSSIGENQKALEAFTAAGVRDQQALVDLSGSVSDFAVLTGQKTAGAVKELAEAMENPKKGAEDLNQKLSFLDSTELQQIQTLVDLGEKTKAQAELARLLKERTDAAAVAAGGLTGWLTQMKVGFADAAREGGHLLSILDRMSGMPGGPLGDGASPKKQNEQQRLAQLRADSAAGSALETDTPEGRAAEARNRLQGAVTIMQKALAADTQLHGANSDAVKKDQQALSEYTRALQSYLSPAEKAHSIAVLDAQIAEAKHKHNEQLVGDLTKQRELLKLGGEVMSPGEAQQRAADAAQLASSRTHAPGGSPNRVSAWAEQLHQQEVASNDFFGDQTEKELQFWQSKLALTSKGSKDYLAVQAKIYEAQKKLAKDAYDDQVADLNEKLENDRENWAKESADWDAKLALIKSKFGEESKEYKDAYREQERAAREHRQQMAQIARGHANEDISERQSNTKTDQEIRNRNLQTQEAAIQQRAQQSGNPFAEVAAIQAINALRQQAMQQQLRDLQAEYDASHADKVRELQDAAQAYGQESAQYQKLIDEKRKLDNQYSNQKRNLENQAAQQQIQAQQRVVQAWHSAVDPLAHSVGAQMKGLINGTETWGQALRNIGSTIEDVIISAIEKVVEQWIVSMIVGKTAQAATAQTGIAAAAAQAGANGVASMAGAPFPMDLTAPAFGAEMAMTAAAFSLGGFDKGMDVVPQDMIAQIHQGERIVPAADNDAMISAMKGGGGRGGDTHINLSHTSNVTANTHRDVIKAIESNPLAFSKVMKKMARNGLFRAA